MQTFPHRHLSPGIFFLSFSSFIYWPGLLFSLSISSLHFIHKFDSKSPTSPMPQNLFALEQNIGDDLFMLYDCIILNWDYLTNVC